MRNGLVFCLTMGEEIASWRSTTESSHIADH